MSFHASEPLASAQWHHSCEVNFLHVHAAIAMLSPYSESHVNLVMLVSIPNSSSEIKGFPILIAPLVAIKLYPISLSKW